MKAETPIYDEMIRTINECYATDEGQSIPDKIERLNYYARIAQNLTPEKQAIEVRIRAEKRAMKRLKQGF